MVENAFESPTNTTSGYGMFDLELDVARNLRLP